MMNKNGELNTILPKTIKNNIDSFREIKCEDARKLPCEDGKATLIVTSPPYVTSYEYADLHQLPLLWLGYLDELSSFRKKFMGSSYKERNTIDLKSKIANNIVAKLSRV